MGDTRLNVTTFGLGMGLDKGQNAGPSITPPGGLTTDDGVTLTTDDGIVLEVD